MKLLQRRPREVCHVGEDELEPAFEQGHEWGLFFSDAGGSNAAEEPSSPIPDGADWQPWEPGGEPPPRTWWPRVLALAIALVGGGLAVVVAGAVLVKPGRRVVARSGRVFRPQREQSPREAPAALPRRRRIRVVARPARRAAPSTPRQPLRWAGPRAGIDLAPRRSLPVAHAGVVLGRRPMEFGFEVSDG